MNILVTGAAGFIGSHLAERLKKLGHDVVGLDQKDLSLQNIPILNLDLAQDDVSSAIPDVDIVFHLAAQSGISQKVSFEAYVRNNIRATYKLLEAVKERKTLKMFVNVASSSVYGAHATGPEETVPAPVSWYGVTKLSAEQLAFAYHRSKKLPVCSMRLFSVYGPRERPEKLSSQYVRAIFDNDYTFTLREGSEYHIRSYTFVDDVVDGLLAVLERVEECNGEIFNLGWSGAITTAHQIELLENASGKRAKVVRVPKLFGDQYETIAVIDKARKILGYNPKINPEEGTKRFVEWYRKVIVPNAV